MIAIYLLKWHLTLIVLGRTMCNESVSWNHIQHLAQPWFGFYSSCTTTMVIVKYHVFLFPRCTLFLFANWGGGWYFSFLPRKPWSSWSEVTTVHLFDCQIYQWWNLWVWNMQQNFPMMATCFYCRFYLMIPFGKLSVIRRNRSKIPLKLPERNPRLVRLVK